MNSELDKSIHSRSASVAYRTNGSDSQGHKILKLDSVGDEVKRIQEGLNYIGSSVLSVDGFFGPKTQKAIMNFQSSIGLNPDGIVGAATKAKLKPILDEQRRNPNQITQNFHEEELRPSEIAAAEGIDNRIPENSPVKEILERNRARLGATLQKIRNELKKTYGVDARIIVNSAFRNDKVNRLVGGSATSEHSAFRAADIRSPDISHEKIAFTVMKMMLSGELAVNQLILEHFNSSDPEGRWVHVSIPREDKLNNPWNEILIKETDGGERVVSPEEAFDYLKKLDPSIGNFDEIQKKTKPQPNNPIATNANFVTKEVTSDQSNSLSPNNQISSLNKSFEGKEKTDRSFLKIAKAIALYEFGSSSSGLGEAKYGFKDFLIVLGILYNRTAAADGNIDAVLKYWNPGDGQSIATIRKYMNDTNAENSNGGPIAQAISEIISLNPKTDIGKQVLSEKWTHYIHLKATREWADGKRDDASLLAASHYYHPDLESRKIITTSSGEIMSVGSHPEERAKIPYLIA